MHLSHPGGHCVDSGQFLPGECVVLRYDIFRQFRRRQSGGIFARIRIVGQFGFELFHDRIRRDSFSFAGLAQGFGPLAAEINIEVLKDAGTARAFGDQFANGPIEQWSSRR